MSTASRFVRLRLVHWGGTALLVAAILWPATAAGGGVKDPRPALNAPPAVAPAVAAPFAFTAPGPSAPVLLADDSGWSWRSLLKPLEFLQGSRRNMIQAATVAMCIALYIIWWRRVVGEDWNPDV
jgi:hypothetical protein